MVLLNAWKVTTLSGHIYELDERHSETDSEMLAEKLSTVREPWIKTVGGAVRISEIEEFHRE